MKRNFNSPTAFACLLLSAMLFFGFCGCGNPSSTEKKAASDSTAVDSTTMAPSVSAAAANNSPKPNWTYQEDSDKMTSKTKYFAVVNANEELQLKAPYDGGVTASITLRNTGGTNEVLLQITKGQFLAGTEGQTIKVRFDALPAEEYECSGPSDYSSTVLFIGSAAKFISKLKKSKKLLIQVELYDNGVQEMEFNVDGLNWPR